jgi:VWFA-related protein
MRVTSTTKHLCKLASAALFFNILLLMGCRTGRAAMKPVQSAAQAPGAADVASVQQTQAPTPAVSAPAAAQSSSPSASAASDAAQTTAPSPAPTQAAPAASGQAPAGQVYTLPSVETNEVNLIFTVTDHKGHFITGLRQENFGLLDDGRPPLSVLQFTQQTNLPLRVGIMLDTSSSIRQRFQFEQDSAVEFFLQVLHLNDRAFVEGFDVQTDLAQDYTNNIDLLNQGIRKLRPGGGTAMFDALYKTCRDQMLTLRDTGTLRRALVLVSDGDDNYSRVQESDAIKMCQRAQTIVYSISTNVSPSKDKGDQILSEISKATGGHAFYPIKIEDVAAGFRSIEEELRSQYSLVYRPANFRNDGSFRTIYLHAIDPRYQVRAEEGYFAPRAGANGGVTP